MSDLADEGLDLDEETLRGEDPRLDAPRRPQRKQSDVLDITDMK